MMVIIYVSYNDEDGLTNDTIIEFEFGDKVYDPEIVESPLYKALKE
jgi:hypothetical protein